MQKEVTPFIPQTAPSYGHKEREAIDLYLQSNAWLTEFEKTIAFEQEIAKRATTTYASVVPNGTIALFLAFTALGIKKGDEVIVPNLTMIATPNAVQLAGGTPVFADVDSESLCLNPDEVARLITPRTKAVCHVSLGGRVGRMESLMKLCHEKGIPLVEDAAQAFGSSHQGKPVGSFGDIGIYSFTPHKIITTGQGGALVTNREDLYQAIERLKDFGRLQGGGDHHDHLGWNFKFTDLQAVLGLVQIENLDERIATKRNIFDHYQTQLTDVPGVTMLHTNLEETTPWFIEVFVEKPLALASFLKEQGIGTRPMYPAIHTQPIYAHIQGEFPVSTHAGAHGLWLPSSLSLTPSEITRICDAVKEFLRFV